MLLTRDCRRLMEDSSYLGIHGDHVVALQGYFLVAVVDLAGDPVLEILPHDSVDDVRKVGSAELLDLLAGWQGPLHLLIILGKGEDVLDCQAFKLWNVYDLDIVAVDDCFHPHGQVTKVPNCDGFIARQICPYL